MVTCITQQQPQHGKNNRCFCFFKYRSRAPSLPPAAALPALAAQWSSYPPPTARVDQ